MKERLSAMMDDQGEPAERAGCLDRVRVDVELQESWAIYHLIGDVLRDTHAGALPQSFAERLSAEPTILAPRAASRAARAPLLRYALPMAAGVAAIAFVAWVGLPQLQPGSQLRADADTPGQAVPVAATPVAATAVPVAATAVPVARDVGDYLLAHQRYSPSSAMSGVAPYVRTVSETGPAR